MWRCLALTSCYVSPPTAQFFAVVSSTRRRVALPPGCPQYTWRIWRKYCIILLCHSGPAPVKTDRAVRLQQTNQVKVNLSSINQSIKRKVHNESLRLIDWFNPPSEKLPHGDDFRVSPKRDSTWRDNTVTQSVFSMVSKSEGRKIKQSKEMAAPWADSFGYLFFGLICSNWAIFPGRPNRCAWWVSGQILCRDRRTRGVSVWWATFWLSTLPYRTASSGGSPLRRTWASPSSRSWSRTTRSLRGTGTAVACCAESPAITVLSRGVRSLGTMKQLIQSVAIVERKKIFCVEI